jgi:hypothetical protein
MRRGAETQQMQEAPMIPHPETVFMLRTLDFQEWRRDAARQRLAASAQVEKHPPVIMPAAVHRVAAAFFGGVRARWSGAHRMRLARPLTTV